MAAGHFFVNNCKYGINIATVYINMDRAYSKNTEIDQTTQLFIQRLVEADEGNNPDLRVEFKGYRHDNLGFTIAFHNMEVYSNDLVERWYSLASEEGMNCSVENDLVNGWVNLKCQRVLRRRTPIRKQSTTKRFKSVSMKSLMYLSIALISIYYLWKRHSDRLLQ